MANRWFPKIEESGGARKLAKQGAIGGLVFASMNIFGMLYAYYSAKSPVDGSAIDAQLFQDQFLGAAILIPLQLFFAYRVYTGKGWFVAGLVLVWFIVEIAAKVLGGTTNLGWIIAYIAIVATMLNGLRACWWLRKENRTQELASGRSGS